MATLAEIYDWFMTGKKPTQAQFWASWGSFWSKGESIPQSSISNLTTVLNAKAEKAQFDAHKTDENAHTALFTAKESKNQKGVASGYAPLNEFAKIANEYLNVVNDLVTGGATSLASAETVKTLKTQIEGINALLTSNDVNLDTVQEIIDAIKIVENSLSSILVNDLTTGGTTKALTAEMGKLLQDTKLTASVATDAEAQITATVTEDNKLVSRSKLHNWWTWTKSRPQSISGIWTFVTNLEIKGGQLNVVPTTGSYPSTSMDASGIYAFNSATSSMRLLSGFGGALRCDNNGYIMMILAPLLTGNRNIYYPNQGGTLAIKSDFLTPPAGTAVTPSIIIPNGILTTIPQNGAIERDANGLLWETHNGVRSQFGQRPYKVYVAKVYQRDYDDPVVSVLENTIGTIVWTRINTGRFNATLTGAFTLGKSVCLQNGLVIFDSADDNDGRLYATATINEFIIEINNSTTGGDSIFDNHIIEFRVYN